MKKNGILFILLLLHSLTLWGQNTLRGTVIGPDGEPLVGATVLVRSTGTGATTDNTGAFSLELPPGDQVLIVTYTGFGTREVQVRAGISGPIEITLEEGVVLRETVVTALGISREKKSLGYAVQEVKGEELARNKDPNLLSSLQGKLAGVQVTSAASQVGASARVVIRGNSSIFGNNQPLFVINGVPTDNSSFSPESRYGGVDFGNALSDISADDIESISVLKGPAAAALYGSRAGNGVVLITTKSGKSASKKGLGVTYSGNFGFTNPLRFWQFQNQFGQGNGQQFRYVDGTGSAPGSLFDGTDESWGPAFDPRINEQDGIDNNGDGTIDEANEGAFVDQYTGPNQPWRAAPNSLLKSLDTGLDFTNNLAITAAGENAHLRFSYTNFYQKGMIPNTDMKRNSFNLAFGAKLSKKLHTDGNVLYVRTDSKNRPPIGYAPSFVIQALWSGRQVDWQDLRNNWNTRDALGRDYNWNHNYYTNPFWEINNNLKPMNRDRVNGYYSLNYALTEWLNIKGRIGNDFYRESHQEQYETVDKWQLRGSFQTGDYTVNERNADVLLTAKHENDNFSVVAGVGANGMHRELRQQTVRVAQITVPGIFNVSNAYGNPTVTEFEAQKTINSVYGNLSLGYRHWLFLDLSGRNDWSSTLPATENAYFYPSANLGVVLSDALRLGNQIDFFKLRAGWARVGNDTDPYQLRPVYQANAPWKGLPSFTVPDVLPNAALKPEIKTSYEFGLEFLALDRRVGLDVTWYNSNAANQILPVDASPTTGFGTRIINAGTVQNRGIEVQLHGTPVKSGYFSWDVGINWASNRSKVLDLPNGVDAILIGEDGGALTQARIGDEYGVIYGSAPLRNAEGKLVLENGLTQVDPAGNVRLGVTTPRWFGGIRNTLTYKNLSLDFLIDGRFGNQFVSWSYILARYTGIIEETLEGRRTADEIKNGYAFDGVIANGDGTYRPNDVKVSAEAWNKHFYPFSGGDFQRAVLNGDFVKLREVTLSWVVPAGWASKIGAQQVAISVYARNVLFLYTAQPHFDPEFQFTPANADQGFEVNQYPAARTIGVQFNASF